MFLPSTIQFLVSQIVFSSARIINILFFFAPHVNDTQSEPPNKINMYERAHERQHWKEEKIRRETKSFWQFPSVISCSQWNQEIDFIAFKIFRIFDRQKEWMDPMCNEIFLAIRAQFFFCSQI